MKVFSTFLAIIICSWIGYQRGEKYRKHYEELLYLKKILLLIRGEIRYNCGTLGEAFGSISKKVKSPYKEIFENLKCQLMMGNGKSFVQIWQECVMNQLQKTELWEQDKTGLMELGENMGYLDMEMQLNFLDLYMEKLNLSIEGVEEKLKGDVKLSRTMGIMGGLLIAILII